jgi:hypothetical protein
LIALRDPKKGTLIQKRDADPKTGSGPASRPLARGSIFRGMEAVA